MKCVRGIVPEPQDRSLWEIQLRGEFAQNVFGIVDKTPPDPIVPHRQICQFEDYNVAITHSVVFALA